MIRVQTKCMLIPAALLAANFALASQDAKPISPAKKEYKIMSNEMLFIPRGEFIMGINKEQAEEIVLKSFSASSDISPYIYYNECPAHSQKVRDFRISQTEVTNEEFQEFVDGGGYQKKELWRELVEAQNLNTDLTGWDRISLFTDATGKTGPSTWKNGRYPEGKGNHPVDGVSWFEAVAYCRWKKMRLPSEAEWEYASRGSDQRLFTWGNDPAVFQKWGTRQGAQSTAAGNIAEDRSPFGVMDLARNVSEWVSDHWYLYSGAPLDPIEEDRAYGIVRGGDYFSQPPQMRTTYRARTERIERRAGLGFRCAADSTR